MSLFRMLQRAKLRDILTHLMKRANYGLYCSMKIPDDGQYDDSGGFLAAMEFPLSGKVVFRIDSRVKHLRALRQQSCPSEYRSESDVRSCPSIVLDN